MKAIKSLFTSCIVVVALATSLQVINAADPDGESGLRKGAKERTIPFNGKLVSVNALEMVFKLRGKEKPRVYHVTASTKIMKDGQKATLDDMGDGDMVGGSALRRGDGEFDAVSVRIGTKVGGAPKQDKKTKNTAE